jgi:DNA-binding NtrC family response regulator
LGIANPGITSEAQMILNNYQWPGNVRELANTIQKAVIFNRGAPISQEDIRKAIAGKITSNEVSEEYHDETLRKIIRNKLSALSGGNNVFDEYMDYIGSILISEALNLMDGNRSRAAQILGLSRPTLHSKIEKYNLKFETSVKEK